MQEVKPNELVIEAMTLINTKDHRGMFPKLSITLIEDISTDIKKIVASNSNTLKLPNLESANHPSSGAYTNTNTAGTIIANL